MDRKFFTTLCFAILSVSAIAQEGVDVRGKYEYKVEDNMTLGKAKSEALQEAKKNALIDKFGFYTYERVVSVEKEINGKLSNVYEKRNEEVVKGKWLSIESSVCTPHVDGDDVFIRAEVSGKAREIKRSQIDVKWKVAKKPKGAHTTTFNDGDNIFIRFRSPIDGYVAAYLKSEDEVQCLVPYTQMSQEGYKVKGDKEYILLDPDKDSNCKKETVLTTEDWEQNVLVLIFSPHKIQKPNVKKGDLDSLSLQEFDNWLKNCSMQDEEMCINEDNILTITQKHN